MTREEHTLLIKLTFMTEVCLFAKVTNKISLRNDDKNLRRFKFFWPDSFYLSEIRFYASTVRIAASHATF